MSVIWQNQKCRQSLVAHGRIKKLTGRSKVECFQLCLNEPTDGEFRVR